MPLNPSSVYPEVIVQFGNINSMGSCNIFFQNTKIIGTFDSTKSVHITRLNPLILLDRADAKVQDLIGAEVGWVATFTNFKDPIQFSFKLDIRQSGVSIINPTIEVTQDSQGVVKTDQSIIFNGFLALG